MPAEWKTAIVTPTFQEGNKKETMQMLESIIKDKITDHLLDNNLTKDTQHGFMAEKSRATIADQPVQVH